MIFPNVFGFLAGFGRYQGHFACLLRVRMYVYGLGVRDLVDGVTVPAGNPTSPGPPTRTVPAGFLLYWIRSPFLVRSPIWAADTTRSAWPYSSTCGRGSRTCAPTAEGGSSSSAAIRRSRARTRWSVRLTRRPVTPAA